MMLRQLGILIFCTLPLRAMEKKVQIFLPNQSNIPNFVVTIALNKFLIKDGRLYRKKAYYNSNGLMHTGYLGAAESLDQEEDNVQQKYPFYNFTDELEQLVEISSDEVEHYFQTNFPNNIQ